MAIVISEGFDLIGSNADLSSKGWANVEGSINTTGSKWGGACYTIGTNQNEVLSKKNDPSIFNEPYFGIAFWVQLSGLTATPSGYLFVSGDTDVALTASGSSSVAHCSVKYGSNGDLIVYRAGSGLITTIVGAMQAGVWHHFELRYFKNSTTGTLEVWWDGIQQVNETNIDTQDSNIAYTGSLTIGGCNNVATVKIDDLVVSQHATTPVARVGSHRIQTLLPTGAGTNSGFTGTFADVDDPFGAADGDTTFVSATTINSEQDYNFGDLSGTPDTIIAVNVVTVARKTDAGAMGLSPTCISSAVTAVGTQVGLSEAYAAKSHIFLVDPNTSAAWAYTAVNAATFGFKITEV